jgi:hypothetical protein
LQARGQTSASRSSAERTFTHVSDEGSLVALADEIKRSQKRVITLLRRRLPAHPQ